MHYLDTFYIRSFWDLSSERNYEFGAIPWTSILKYGHHVGLDADIIDTFIAIIRAMDAGFIEWSREQVTTERKHARAQQKSAN